MLLSKLFSSEQPVHQFRRHGDSPYNEVSSGDNAPAIDPHQQHTTSPRWAHPGTSLLSATQQPAVMLVMTAGNANASCMWNTHVIRASLWLAVACIVAGLVSVCHGKKAAVEFAAACVLECSLSIDNVFVFMLIFKHFRVAESGQETVLKWGVAGAVILRGAMMFLGMALVEKFHLIYYVLAVTILWSAAKLLLVNDDDDDDDIADNPIVKWAKLLIPCTAEYHGNRFFIFNNDGSLLATPLLLVAISIELSDAVFALDSVPAVLGLSKSTVVMYLSNILAVMGLRTLFFAVNGAMENMRYLQQALGLELGFVGVKMILSELFGFEVPVLCTLAVVVGIPLVGVLLSRLFPESEEEMRTNESSADFGDASV